MVPAPFNEISYFPFGFPVLDFPERTEDFMDQTRCPKCNKRLMAMTDRTGRTELHCLKCDKVDPMKADAAKWADSPLAAPTKAA
jgi:phage FluMu protein Com